MFLKTNGEKRGHSQRLSAHLEPTTDPNVSRADSVASLTSQRGLETWEVSGASLLAVSVWSWTLFSPCGC